MHDDAAWLSNETDDSCSLLEIYSGFIVKYLLEIGCRAKTNVRDDIFQSVH